MVRKRSISLTNDTSALLAVYIEPYPNEYWLRPTESVVISGQPKKGQIEVVPFDHGMTIYFGEDPDPTVIGSDGSPIQPGHQRP